MVMHDKDLSPIPRVPENRVVVAEGKPVHSIVNHLGVDQDQDALALFLRRAERRSQETLRRYTRELVRFTAFLRKELTKGYRELTLADVEIYMDFLHNPWPEWRVPGKSREHPEKVYFPYAIKPGKSTDQIMTVISSFFNYLHVSGYNAGNPFKVFDKSGEKVSRGHKQVKFFFRDEWEAVLQGLASYPENTQPEQLQKERLRYMFSLTYGAALRESELAMHTCRDILSDQNGDLVLSIQGKGRKWRQLPVTPDMYRAITHYRAYHNMGPLQKDFFPLAPAVRPVCVEKDGSYVFKSIKVRQIRKWFADFMDFCARTCSGDNFDLAERLKQKSFHSLRHTALSHLARNMDIEDLSIFAGHESITTTQQYYTPEKERLRTLTLDHQLYRSDSDRAG